MDANTRVLASGKAAGQGTQRFGTFIKCGKSVKRRLRERLQALASLGRTDEIAALLPGLMRQFDLLRTKMEEEKP